jgi:hypothetical protein
MKTSVSAPPPAPAPVDPGKASLDYINAMADPALQEKLLGAEQQFRPQYTKLNLQEQEQYLRGVDGQAGVIDILNQVTPQLVQTQETADRLQRDADIRALQSQSGGYLSALMQANPQMFAQLEAARGMGGKTDFYGGLQNAITGAQRFGDVGVAQATANTIDQGPQVDLQGYQATTGTAAQQAAAQPVSLQGFQAAQGQATMAGAAPQAQAALLGGAPTMQAVSAGAVPMVQQQGFQAERAAAPTLGAAPTVQQQGYQAAQMQAALLGAAPQVAAQGYQAQGYNAAQAAAVADIAAQQVQQGQLGQALYQQALQAAPTSASETFRQRAAQMATSTGQLSPEELRNAQQATREAFAARGLEMSNQAIAAEAMSRAGAVRERQAQDIQQASALNQAYLADLGASRGFATGVYGQDLGLQQANQAAMLQAAQSNQGVAAQMSLANQAAMNQASQFGASAANQAGQFGATAQNAAAMANAQQAAQFAMANQQAQMSAASANMAALNQAGQFGATAQNAAAMANADRAAQFALANQGILSQTGLANMAAGNQAAQFGASAQNAAAMANAEQAARFALANQQAGMQAGQFNAQQAAQFALANQQASMQANLANQALLGQYGLSNQSAANQFGLANMQAAQEAAQFGAGAANQATLANQQAFLQQAAANQQAQQQMALANIEAQNAAAQFGAGAANQGRLSNQDVAMRAALANQAAQNQVGLFNAEQLTNMGLANRAFQASQQQQNIANLGMLGQAQQGEMAANRAYQSQLVGLYGAAFDPMSVVLGRPSGALGVGQNQQGLATGMMQSMGGQVFDPNAGVNLALQQNANLGNYQAATYGARAAAQGAITAAKYQAGGNILSSIIGCWVAREVYGETNPRWMMFREWLVMKSPSWFKKLYFKHGEGFAAWLKNKPRIKNLIRKWMDSRINNYLFS